MVPKRLKLIIFTEKLFFVQEITTINNYTVLLGLLFWPRWYVEYPDIDIQIKYPNKMVNAAQAYVNVRIQFEYKRWSNISSLGLLTARGNVSSDLASKITRHCIALK